MVTILIRTLIIYLTVSIVLRCMGKRQVGELELSDLVATLILSEAAAMPIADHNMPLLNALIPILVILSLEIILTYLKTKIAPLKKVLEGRPSILICRGRLDQGELEKMRISVEELISECRLKGFASLADIEYAILEQDGQLSVFDKKDKNGIAHPVITDGQIHDRHLKLVKKDRAWLTKECKKRGCAVEDVFLMTVDDTGSITFLRKEKKS